MGMNYVIMTQRKPKQQQASRKQSRPVDAAFEVWLQRGLHALYDGIAREPVPDELLKLIEEDREK
jgi:Anti-sigma factor NepR